MKLSRRDLINKMGVSLGALALGSRSAAAFASPADAAGLHQNADVSGRAAARIKSPLAASDGENPTFDAERIRLAAGKPDWIRAGAAEGVAVGVDTSVTLKRSGRMTKASFSGTGPFLLENLLFDNLEGSTAAGALEFIRTDVPIQLTIRNCKFSGYSTYQVYFGLHPDSQVTIERCEVYAGARDAKSTLLRMAQGNLTVRQSLFWGTGGNGIHIERHGKVLIENCRFGNPARTDQPAMRAIDGTAHWQHSAYGGTVTARQCETIPGQVREFLYANWPRTYAVEKCRLVGTMEPAITNNTSSYMNELGFKITLCDFENNRGGGVKLHAVGNAEVGYCTFNTARGRLCSFFSKTTTEAAYLHDIEIHHCKGTQTDGVDSFSGYECFILYGFAKDSSIHDCWVTQCTDDAFEATNPRSNVHFYNNVGDKVAHEVVDYWNDGAYRDYNLKNQFGNSIHHIYGAILNRGIMIGGQIGLEVRHIYHTRDASVSKMVYGIVLQKTTMGTGYPDHCRIISPIPLAATNMTPISIGSDIGKNNVILRESGAEAAPEPAVAGPFPNPFGSTCTLTVTVPETQQVRVELYDVLGRQVGVVYEGGIRAEEPTPIVVDGNALASGVYLFRVTGDNFSIVRKAVRLS